MVDLATATATQLIALLDTGDVSSSELLEDCLERVGRYNGELVAVVAMDLDGARLAAKVADNARLAGQVTRPLNGLPMTVKDVFETEGLVTTSGAVELAAHVPDRDAEAVARLRAAGAIIYGKTNVPRYAGDFQTHNELHGLTVNPWNPDRTAGGSSGGSAVAVATGMSALELGSDIAGSIRAPAHYCGVFGHLPSWAAVPNQGHIPPAPGSLSIPALGGAGPLGRSADDLELALDVLVGPDLCAVPGGKLPDSTVHSLRGCRVGLWLDNPLARTDKELLRVLRGLADRLADAGVILVEGLRPPRPFYEMHEVYAKMLFGVLSASFTEDEYRELLAVAVAPEQTMARAVTQTYRDWQAFEERRARVESGWPRLFEQIDVMLTPVTPLPAFPHNIELPAPERELQINGRPVPYYVHMVWTNLASMARLPATVVPAGFTADGLPVGAQLIGPRWSDRTTIGVARLVEQLTGGFKPPPLIARPPQAASEPSAGRRP